jgi:hypothetical protein
MASEIKVDTISEKTSANGVSIDSVKLKDGTVDVNGVSDGLILDADADTTISADTDDQIDIKIAGADDFKFTANNFNILSGSTLTVDSGATIANSGTATGFGTIAWQSVVTGATTMVAGRGYFVNTTSSAFTMTLPSSASIGDTIAIIDYAGTFDSNTCTIGRNSHKIQGASADMTVTTERAAFRLVYVDATQGWLLTQK